MQLGQAEVQSYKENGYIFIENQFSQAELEQMRAELPGIFAEEGPQKVMEKDGRTVRSVYGSHTSNEFFWQLVRSDKVLEPAQQLVDSQLYTYQFKINAKAAFGGDLWEWHQDFIFWHKEDGMPEPRVTNAVIFLDDVTEVNGPLFLVPGSHHEGMIDPFAAGTDKNELALGLDVYKTSPSWISNLTADLKYSLKQAAVARLVERYGVVSCKGKAGSLLFFHPNVVHGSGTNMSPFNRTMILVTYNSTANVPQFPEKRRPEFLASSDCRPLTVMSSDHSIPVFAAHAGIRKSA